MIISWTKRAFEVKQKTFFLASQVLSFKHAKQTSKNVTDTTHSFGFPNRETEVQLNSFFKKTVIKWFIFITFCGVVINTRGCGESCPTKKLHKIITGRGCSQDTQASIARLPRPINDRFLIENDILQGNFVCKTLHHTFSKWHCRLQMMRR